MEVVDHPKHSFNFFLRIREKYPEQAGFAVPHSSLTIGLVGLGWGPEKNVGPEKV